jgi:excisionase family DNA binding protein
MEKKLFTVEEAQSALNGTLSRPYLYRLVKTQQIPSIRIGRKVLIKGAWIQAILSEADRMDVTTK